MNQWDTSCLREISCAFDWLCVLTWVFMVSSFVLNGYGDYFGAVLEHLMEKSYLIPIADLLAESTGLSGLFSDGVRRSFTARTYTEEKNKINKKHF